jgi:hypothetical protein
VNRARVAMRAARRAAALAAIAVIGLELPARGWALCPNCLGQRSALTPALKLIGIFLAIPFAVAAVVYLVVRRGLHGRGLDASAPSAPASGDGGNQGG